uniref:Uncharacterized protein n=1 Tax=Glossina pallidipes TaxID=7398 RepID=A0A1B0A3Z7_GLOPL
MDLASRNQLKETVKKLTQLEVLDMSRTNSAKFKRLFLEILPEENHLHTIVLNQSYDDDEDDEYYYGDGNLKNLVELIVRKWSNSLKCLKWRFLKENVKQLNFLSSKLRCLHLFFDCADSDDLLHSLAPNKTLTELKLANEDLGGEEFYSTLIQRLPNLTELDLSALYICDEDMTYIFRYLVHMRKLFLPPCSGNPNEEDLLSKPNISELKRLQTFQSCLRPIKVLPISNSNFKFQELIKLHLLDCLRNKRFCWTKVVDTSMHFPVVEEFSTDITCAGEIA